MHSRHGQVNPLMVVVEPRRPPSCPSGLPHLAPSLEWNRSRQFLWIRTTGDGGVALADEGALDGQAEFGGSAGHVRHRAGRTGRSHGEPWV